MQAGVGDPGLGLGLHARMAAEATRPLVIRLADVRAGQDRSHTPLGFKHRSRQQRTALLGSRHREHSAKNDQLLLTDNQRLWHLSVQTQ